MKRLGGSSADRMARALAAVASSIAALCVAPSAGAACRMQSAELPVVVTSDRILIPAEIGSKPVFFIYDTGAAYSLLHADVAGLLGLGTRENNGLTMYGAGGSVHARSIVLPDLRLGAFQVGRSEMLISPGVSPTTPSGRPIVGLIGSDIFGANDVEFDLAHHAVRLLKPNGCDDDDMVYWGAAYSKAPIIWRSGGQHVDVDVALNGRPVEAILDTGAPMTTVTLGAAARVGVGVTSPGARRIGSVGGIGSGLSDLWIGDFDSVAIGNEKIAHVKLMMSDIYRRDQMVQTGSRLGEAMADNEMLLGLDFVKSHRVLLSRSHNTLYFSYNGGAIFRADQPVSAPAATTPAAAR